MKRRICMLLTALLILTGLFSACAPAEQAPTTVPAADTQTKPAAANTPEPTPEDPFAKRISWTGSTLSGGVDMESDFNSDDVYKFLNEMFNFEIKVYPLTNDTWAERTKLWIVSEDMPDQLFWNINAADYQYYVQEVGYRFINLGSDVSGLRAYFSGIGDHIKTFGVSTK